MSDLYRKRVPWADSERRPLFCGPARPLAALLDATALAGARQLFVTCGWDAAHTPAWDWWKAPASEGWCIESPRRDPAGARYTRGETTIDVRSSAAWFGDETDTARIKAAYFLLQERIRRSFDRGAVLMGSPARTGADLLERSLPDGYRYPSAPADVADILTHNYGQGRMEFCVSDAARRQRPKELFIYDALWMYAACVRSWPVGPVVHDECIDFEPYRPGWYRITFRSPDGWGHIGLLPTLRGYDDEHTVWPVDGTTWASEPEIRLALAHGWDVRVRERILFAPSNTPGADPAREWAERLHALRASCDASPVGKLHKAAIRNLLIQTVGYLGRTHRAELQVTPPDQGHTIPDDAEDVTVIYPDGDPMRPPLRIEWMRPAPLETVLGPYARREWAASAWAQSRARLARFALAVPRDQVVALRTDSVITTGPLCGVKGMGGRIGEFRLKAVIPWGRPLAQLAEETYRDALGDNDE